jgi:hypothetical protein
MNAEWHDLHLWGNRGKALIVEPDTGPRYVFWQKAQYVPCIELARDVWFTTEWMETGSIEDRHCYEPIMDKECRYSSVALLDVNDVRAVVAWKYALCNPRYEIFHGDTTAEERYTIFPDGTAVRTLVGWPGKSKSLGFNPTLWEVGEFILINGVGSVPSDVLQGYSIGNLSGDRVATSWPAEFKGSPSLCKLHPQTAEWKECVGILHVRDHPDPFVGFSTAQSMFPHSSCTSCGKDHPEIRCYGGGLSFVHWPAYDATDFAGWIKAEREMRDRATHTSLFSFGYSYGGHSPPTPSTWFFLVGTSESGDPYELVRSWLRPGRVRTNHVYTGYSTSLKSHTVYRRDSSPCEITLACREPVVNPSFRIENSPLPARIELDGEECHGTRCLAHAGTDESLSLWIKGRMGPGQKMVIY